LVYIGMVLTDYPPRNCSTRQSALSATSPFTMIAPAGQKVLPRYISRRKEMARRPSSSITIGSSMGVSIACFHLFASLPFSYPILRRHTLHFRSDETVALRLCSGSLLASVSCRFSSGCCGFKYVRDGVTLVIAIDRRVYGVVMSNFRKGISLAGMVNLRTEKYQYQQTRLYGGPEAWDIGDVYFMGSYECGR